MSRRQSWRLGRTFAFVGLIIWFANNWVHSFELSVALILVSAVAMILLLKGSPE
jgi:hypothetical protein